MNGFREGEYIIYVNGDKYEIGRIKSLRPDGAFIAYHEGETGAKTPYDRIHKLQNAYTIKSTMLGGRYFTNDLISRWKNDFKGYVNALNIPRDDYNGIMAYIDELPSAQSEPCDLCSNLEKGDTLYQSSDWDGGIGFDYIRDIQFCPKCGRRLE